MMRARLIQLLAAAVAPLIPVGLRVAAGQEAACWQVLDTFAQSQAELRPALLETLPRLTDPRAAPVLRAVFPNVPARSKPAFALALARLGDEAAGPVLVQLLDSTDRAVAAHSAAGLERLGDPRGARWLDDRLRRGRDEWAAPCTEAIVAAELRGHLPALNRLVRDMRTPEPWRCHAVAALVALKDPDALPAADRLLRTARDPCPLIALLGRTGRPEVFPVLEEASRRLGAECPQAFLDAFLALGDARAIPVVRAARDTPEAPERALSCTLVLAALGDPESIAWCLARLGEGPVDAADLAAAKALSQCPDPRAEAGLCRLADPERPQVFQLVVRALAARRDDASAHCLRKLAETRDEAFRRALLERMTAWPTGASRRVLETAFARAPEGDRPALAAALLVSLQEQRAAP